VRKPKLLANSHVLGSFLSVVRCENNSQEFTMVKEKQRNENLSLAALVVSPRSIIHRRCVSTNDVFIAFVCFVPLINKACTPSALRKCDGLEE
jgi:hypothetical protein